MQPALLLAGLLWRLALAPALAPAFGWLPGGLGRALVGAAAVEALAVAGGRAVLSRRLERVVLCRAAGAAGSLPPDVALGAFDASLEAVAATLSVAADDDGSGHAAGRDRAAAVEALRLAYAAQVGVAASPAKAPAA